MKPLCANEMPGCASNIPCPCDGYKPMKWMECIRCGDTNYCTEHDGWLCDDCKYEVETG